MNVPFVDLAAQCQAPRPELEPALQAVLERGAFVMILSLPMFPEITPQQIEQVVSVLRAVLGAPTLA